MLFWSRQILNNELEPALNKAPLDQELERHFMAYRGVELSIMISYGREPIETVANIQRTEMSTF